MRIVTVAFPFAAVTDATAGGSEQVARSLDRAIAEQGWDSIVIAARGSEVRGRLVPIDVPSGAIDAAKRAAVWARTRAAIERTLVRHDVDLVHFHGVDFAAYLPPSRVAALATLHLPLHCYHRETLQAPHVAIYLNGVSTSQLAAAPPLRHLLGAIPNGIDLGGYAPAGDHDDFVFSLGRICPEKGFHLALDAARLARTPMLLAGAVFPYAEHQHYFAAEIAPRLGMRARFVGAVAARDKQQLLARARCVLVPSLIDETSSLVTMEALACGTPVVAFRAGALPELIDDGCTGLLVDSVEEMADAIERVGTIDRCACRAAAEARFGRQRMLDAYFRAYERVTRAESRA